MEIKLPSYISEHWSWTDPVRFQWWIMLLKMAAESDKEVIRNGKKILLHRGEIIVTQGEIAKLWNISIDTAKGFIRKLISTGDAERRPNADPKLTHLYLTNIEDYAQVRPDVDPMLTQYKGNSDLRPNLDPILTQSTIEESEDYAERRPNADPKLTRTEKEKRKEKESFPPPPLYKEKENKKEKELRFTDVNLCRPADADDEEGGIDFKKLLAFFNEKMKGKMIPQVRAIIGKRRQAVLARSKEYGKTAIMTAILNAADSEFLNGGNDRAFVASFDWIFRPNNFPKVLENNYANKIIPTQQNGTTHRNITTSAEARQQRQGEFAAHIFDKLARGQNPGPTEGD
ncbi:MAG: hypothetical protein NC411_02790 [Bacteroides sp.]|nr:hypothetical protein [Bacteroides sp.]